MRQPREYTAHELADTLRAGPDLPVALTVIDHTGYRQWINADVRLSVERDGIGARRLVIIGVHPEYAND